MHHVKATLVRNSGTQAMTFPLEKTKGGKFTYATQKNLEQLFEALDAFSCVIFEVEEDNTGRSGSVAEFTDAVRQERMINACKWLRSQFNLELTGAVQLLRDYFNWPNNIGIVQREIGLNRILHAMQTGVIRRR